MTQMHFRKPFLLCQWDLVDLHLQAKDTLEAHVTEHFRLSGVYWGLTALYLIGKLDLVDGAAIVDWVRSVHKCLSSFTYFPEARRP